MFIVWGSSATYIAHHTKIISPPDTIIKDSLNNDKGTLPYPFNNGYTYPFNGNQDSNALYLHNPPNITNDIEYDPETNSYIFKNSVDNYDITPPNSMSYDDFQNYDLDKTMKAYWNERNNATGIEKGKLGIPKIHIGGEAFDRIFGGNTIDIRPQGSAELIFGLNAMRREDPSLDVKQRKTANFDFQEKIQMNVTAKIGDKIQLATNYNTEATFDFENKMKLAYEGKEDEIVKLIEAGDVTLPLNSTLITGCQSLFGLKTKLQFGKTTVTSVFAQQKSKTSTVNVSGGAQTSTFNIKADQYEENKHFFIAQYFRNRYNTAMKKLPIINSNVNITKMEVWVTNIGAATTENRNIVALMDIGECTPNIYNTGVVIPNSASPGFNPSFPSNKSNNLYAKLTALGVVSNIRNINTINSALTGGSFHFVSGLDFEKVELARKLLPSEYTYNSKLGFISINSALNPDQALAVAFQYTIIGDTTVYQVGEFSTSIAGPNTLIVKLLKSTSLNTHIPIWNLMMKNVYSLGAYQVNSEDFRLNVVYTSNENGVPIGYFTQGNDSVKGIPIIRLLNLDNLNTQLDPTPDGVFDFIDNAAIAGGTIQSSNGRIYFPVLEPFGKDLRAKFNNNTIADKYCFDSLYTMTKTGAQQYPDKDKFSLIGNYKSKGGSEISLNAMNVPQGSVKVTAGGIQLNENVDYTVDYTLGRVKIINEGILNSGVPIQITLESNSLFNIQTKTMMGAHFDHVVNKNLTLGATILNLSEKPITQKINYGDEPISNTIWGLNGTYEKESMFITKLLDKLPFYSTKTPSKITMTGEFADLIPGHSKAIGKTGTSYIDDFEGSQSTIDMKNIGSWYLASTPQGQISNFPEGAETSLKYRFNAARLCWYVIDPSVFKADGSLLPPNITKNDLSNHYVRTVYEAEVFPNKETPNGEPTNIAVLNLAFYPTEKGPYNYNVNGISSDGLLNKNNPAKSWGGIMRKIETTDFESTNMEYIEFWMMDPFVDPDGSGNGMHNGGDLYFNLGDISEDVLKDSRKSFENGLPTSAIVTNVDTTIWGRVPTIQAITNSFDNNPAARQYQDVGLDGLMDADERTFFDTAYVHKLETLYGASSQAYLNASADPSSDDYHYFRGGDYDNDHLGILDRYKKFNGMEGNSPADAQNPESYPTQATTIPNAEDISRDNTLNESERYFQYKVQLRPNKMRVGENYITDSIVGNAPSLPNGNPSNVTWYQFKIPIHSPDQVIGNIQDFKSIRFMRMFMKGFTENAVLRFATLELSRGEWRKYNFSLLSPGEYIPDDNVNNTTFDISVVNIEENGKRSPIPYVIPPGIEREINLGTTNLQKMNEQALSLRVCNLMDGDARSCYKTCDFDMRQFKHLKMFVHEEKGTETEINKGDLTIFLRLGTDFTNNYYEYEIPLTPTPWNTPASDANLIWPDSNSFDIVLSLLENAKMNRNVQMRIPGSGVTLSTPYTTYDHGRKITVIGMPTLSAVETIMIGIRNPKKSANNPSDDGLPKCAEIWVNELRLTDFNEHGGWAATSTINATLADLGTITLAGKISTPGFGSIEKKINERQKSTDMQYDIATSLELGKFLPEKTGIKIPMHVDYSKIISNPEYNPLNPDILFQDDLNSYIDKNERDSVKSIVQDYTMRKSINFVNVRKEKTGTTSKSHIYDVENLDFTYSFTEQYHRNVDVEYDLKKEYKGAIGYNFTNSPKNYVPLSKVKFLSYGPLKLLKDFNFYLMPKTLSFRTDMDRLYSEDKIRNTSQALLIIDPTYVKNFTWNRDYGFKFDITQNLKLDFSATTNARIDEPPGLIDRSDPDYGWKRDSIIHNIKDFGRVTNYGQTLNVNYAIPINKISWFNWVTASAKYTGGYTWDGAPLSAKELGNTIENSNIKQLNGSFNFTSLYNKVGYFKKLNQQKTMPSKLKQTKTTSIVKNKKSNKNQQPATDTTGKDTTKVDYLKAITDNVLKFLMGVKNISFTYSQGNGTFLPGFIPSPVMLGEDWSWRHQHIPTPGTGFVFGDQHDIRRTAAEHGWISTDSMLNTAYATKFTENFSARATVEPVSKLLIEITATRTFSRNYSEYYKYDPDANSFRSFNPMETGSYSVSYLSWNTSFVKNNKTTYSNNNFENFKDYRLEIAARLAQQNPNWDGTYVKDSITGKFFPSGYGPTSQEVLIPAFLAAYTGNDPKKVSLNAFSEKFSLKDFPMPNWRITYDGLTKIPLVKEYLKTVSISHAYKSTYSVGGYASNILFSDKDGDGYTAVRDELSKNFISRRTIAQLTISEQFSPLINIDMTWNNSLLSNFEIKKSRDLSLSFANNQLTEVTSSEFIIGLGYRIKNVVINIKGLNGGKTKKLKSDLNLKSDISIKTNQTILRQLVENVDQISNGQRIISINTSADYLINDKFTIKFFFDKIITNPFVSSQFPNSNTNAGFSLRFTLAQ
jgi:cell surface protein SprA